MIYVITGATGNIGSGIAHRLLDKGAKVRVVARNRSKLQKFADRGAEVVAGSLTDTKFLTQALEEATAAYFLIPPDMAVDDYPRFQDETGESIVAALKNSKVTHILDLSSNGADLPAGTGPIAGLYRQEQRLNKLQGKNILHLRPGYFMENLLMYIPMIREMNMLGSSIKADLALPIIATKDIADAAADRLLKLDFTGNSYIDLLGQKDLSLAEATRVAGESIGKPDLQYITFSYEEDEKGMIQSGLKPTIAKLYVEMARALNERLIKPLPRTKENTTPTSIEEFAKTVFSSAYRSTP
jgi:uncharacterized protein YbjT (DUF2867 family)